MTLRVRISIVPFGDEAKEREIHQINISNLGRTETPDVSIYGVEVDKYKTDEYDATLDHMRQDGPLSLVYNALGEIVE